MVLSPLETVTVPGGATSAFFGYISAEPILTVKLKNSAGAGEGELIGMAAFGTCDGGGGGGGCGDFSYANTSQLETVCLHKPSRFRDSTVKLLMISYFLPRCW